MICCRKKNNRNFFAIRECLDHSWHECEKKHTENIANSDKGDIINYILKKGIKNEHDLLDLAASTIKTADNLDAVPSFEDLISNPKANYRRNKLNKPLAKNIQKIIPIDELMIEYKKISKYGVSDGDKAIAKVGDTDWYLQNKARSKFHQDRKLPGIELKLVHIDGREAVYNSETCLLIKQDDIMGTYNYFNGNGVPSWIERPNKGNDLLHGMYDVLPYILWGTTAKNAKNSTVFERLLKIL